MMASLEEPPVGEPSPAPQSPPSPGEAAATVARNSGLGSLADDLRELADNAQTLVEAELAYQSARAAYAWNRGRAIALWLIVAIMAAFFALVALVVGLLFALVPYVGVWGSLGIVAIGLIAIAGFAVLRASAKFRRMRNALLASDPIQPPSRLVPAPLPPGPVPPLSPEGRDS